MFVAAIGIICIVGLLTELHMEKRRKKALDNQLAEKDRELEAKLAEEKNFCIVTGRKWKLTWKIFLIS